MRTRRRRRRDIAKNGGIIGLSGALSVAVIETILQRMPALSTSPALTAMVRIAGGFGAALIAERAGASDSIVDGILAGPVLVTGLDLGTRLIGSRRPEPPAAGRLEDLGQPWHPQLLG